MIRIIRCLSLFLAACVLISAADIAESQVAVKVVFVKGSPKIMKADTGEWAPCSLDMVIDNGDRIKTVKDEVLELSFAQDNSNILRVNEGSDVIVKKGDEP